MTTTKGKMQNSFSCLFLATPAYTFAPRTNTKRIMEDVSYHRHNAEIVTLEAWMVMDNPESDRWIWVRVESDSSRNIIEEQFLTKDSYRKEELHSLEECFDYYERKNAE